MRVSRERVVGQASGIFRLDSLRLVIQQDPRARGIARGDSRKRQAVDVAVARHLEVGTARKARRPDAGARIIEHHEPDLAHPRIGIGTGAFLHSLVIPVDGDGGDFRLRGQRFEQTIITPFVQLRHRHIGKVAAEKQVVGHDGIHVGNHALNFRAVKQRVHVNVAEKYGSEGPISHNRDSFRFREGIRRIAGPISRKVARGQFHAGFY